MPPTRLDVFKALRDRPDSDVNVIVGMLGAENYVPANVDKISRINALIQWADSSSGAGLGAIMEHLGQIAGSTNRGIVTTSSPQPIHAGGSSRMFDRKRLERVEELLEIDYELQQDYEKKLRFLTGSANSALKVEMKRELLPRLRQLENEYAKLLAAGVPEASLPEAEAGELVTELAAAVAPASPISTGAPPEIAKTLTEIRDILAKPDKSASAKLKLSLPLVPGIASYELEADTEKVVTGVWASAKNFFKGYIGRNP